MSKSHSSSSNSGGAHFVLGSYMALARGIGFGPPLDAHAHRNAALHDFRQLGIRAPEGLGELVHELEVDAAFADLESAIVAAREHPRLVRQIFDYLRSGLASGVLARGYAEHQSPGVAAELIAPAPDGHRERLAQGP